MPAKQEKIMGESVWGAGRPRRDSHWSGGKENTSPTCLRGMFTAPGIAPSEASSCGWRGNCREVHMSRNLSHVHNKDILGGQGSAELLIGGGGWEKSGGGRRRKKSQEGKYGWAGRRKMRCGFLRFLDSGFSFALKLQQRQVMSSGDWSETSEMICLNFNTFLIQLHWP